MTTPTERTSYSKGNSTCYGYIAEWRLKPESAVLKTLLPYPDVSPKWAQALYTVSELARLGPDANKLVRPYIHEIDTFNKSQHGLVNELAAEAIIACLKTVVRYNMIEHIEWRTVRIRLTSSHEMVLDDRDTEVEVTE